MAKLTALLFLICPLGLSGCTSYFVSKESLMVQFANSNTGNGNSLKTLTCVNANGREKTIKVTDHTKAILVSKKEGAKLNEFYLNTIVLKDSIISGCKSHSVSAAIEKCDLKYISKIRIKR